MASPSPAMGNILKAVTPQIVRERIRAVDAHIHFIPGFYQSVRLSNLGGMIEHIFPSK